MKITLVPHQGKPSTHEISAEDVAAIRRWEAAGSLVEDQCGWDDITDDQREDAYTAQAWKCHDLQTYTLTNKE